MTLPDYQTLMLPLLKFAGDEREHTLSEARQTLANTLGLIEKDTSELLPSGQQTVFANRVAWAKTYLEKAGLLASPRRGSFLITQRGLGCLKESPTKVDVHYLSRFPEFLQFRGSKPKASQTPSLEDDLQKTPVEMIEDNYLAIRRETESELLDKIKAISPKSFENLVVQLLVRMGYGGNLQEAGMAVGQSGDEGIDGIIKEDRLGLDLIYIQAKRWKDSTVGRPEVQKFAGALQGKRAKKGIFIATSTFSKEAKDFVLAIEAKIVLIDGPALVQLMFENDLGVSLENNYSIKRVDHDFFEEL